MKWIRASVPRPLTTVNVVVQLLPFPDFYWATGSAQVEPGVQGVPLICIRTRASLPNVRAATFSAAASATAEAATASAAAEATAGAAAVSTAGRRRGGRGGFGGGEATAFGGFLILTQYSLSNYLPPRGNLRHHPDKIRNGNRHFMQQIYSPRAPASSSGRCQQLPLLLLLLLSDQG